MKVIPIAMGTEQTKSSLGRNIDGANRKYDEQIFLFFSVFDHLFRLCACSATLSQGRSSLIDRFALVQYVNTRSLVHTPEQVENLNCKMHIRDFCET